MVSTANHAGIPYQIEILELGSTDGRVIQLSRSGVHVGGVSIPARYLHTPSEMIDFHDYEQAIQLVMELLSNPIQLKK